MTQLEATRNSRPRKKRKLWLFCRHPLAQERFTRLLEHSEFVITTHPTLQVPAPAEAGDDNMPQLLVIDSEESIATLEFLRTLQSQHHPFPILVLLPSLEESLTSHLLRLGVKGLLTYEQSGRELCRAARQVAAGGYWVPREQLARFVESVLPELQGCKSLDEDVDISRREREVLDLLLENLCNKEIAGKLYVSERTVKFHVSNLLAKFGVQRRADLIVLWMQRNRSFPWLAPELARTVSSRVN